MHNGKRITCVFLMFNVNSGQLPSAHAHAHTVYVLARGREQRGRGSRVASGRTWINEHGGTGRKGERAERPASA